MHPNTSYIKYMSDKAREVSILGSLINEVEDKPNALPLSI